MSGGFSGCGQGVLILGIAVSEPQGCLQVPSSKTFGTSNVADTMSQRRR